MACPADAVAPTPPIVTDNCDRPITASAGVRGTDPACGGPKTWTFTYTDCDGGTYDWVYTYTILAPTVSLPAPGASAVACPADAVAPTPPTVTDNCDRPIAPRPGVPSTDPACGGPKTWTFTYTDCDGALIPGFTLIPFPRRQFLCLLQVLPRGLPCRRYGAYTSYCN